MHADGIRRRQRDTATHDIDEEKDLNSNLQKVSDSDRHEKFKNIRAEALAYNDEM